MAGETLYAMDSERGGDVIIVSLGVSISLLYCWSEVEDDAIEEEDGLGLRSMDVRS